MTGRLAGKRVAFIGGVTNIGRAAVEALAAAGARIVVGDINREAGTALAASLGEAVTFDPVDVRSEEDVRRFIDAAAERLGGLDALCQNAGLLRSGWVTEFAADDWDAVFAVNVRAQFFGVKYAVPHLRAAGKGSIVNMSSLAGKHGGPGRAAYSAAKGAVIGMGASLAAELAADNIRVNTICPGWVDTPFNDPAVAIIGGADAVERMVKATVPLGRQGTPAEIAPIFVYLVSDESSYMTAQSIVIDGGSYS
jgi:NAD(P)-dependent dehydrogenase (short-subunit alcohol dehydrogenase family)